MNKEQQDDKLLTLPPKDLILSLRRYALFKAEDKRLKRKVGRANIIYNELLEDFACGFFHDGEIYHTLKPQEKNELAKIYAFYCRKSLFLKISSFAGLSGLIIWFAFLNLAATLVAGVIGIAVALTSFCLVGLINDGIPDWMSDFVYSFKNSWKFLSARRLLKRLGIDEKKIFLENQKTGS